MKCPNCQAENKKGTIFCTHCGMKLNEIVPNENTFKRKEAAEKKRITNSLAITIVIATLFIIGVGICGYYFLIPNNQKEVSNKPQDVHISNYYLDADKIGYRVNINMEYPEGLSLSDEKPLTIAIMSKAFGRVSANMNEAISEYLSTYGERQDGDSAWNISKERHTVTLNVKDAYYSKDKYISIEIDFKNTLEDDSPRIIQETCKFVNYDITNQKVLKESDILKSDLRLTTIYELIQDNWNTNDSTLQYLLSIKQPISDLTFTNQTMEFCFDVNWTNRVYKGSVDVFLMENFMTPQAKSILLNINGNHNIGSNIY